MYYPIFQRKLLPVVISAMVVTACSGGNSGAVSTATSDGSNDSDNSTTKTSSTFDGRITGFGSVIVNGVHFEVDNANILHDGAPITEEDLKVGMIVRLSGSVDADGVNGTAVEIEFDEEVKGVISSIDVANGSFIVLGQTVTVDEDTVFDETTLDTLAVGNLVEVSGLVDADGLLRASLVELEKASVGSDEEIEVKGVVRSHNSATQQFMLRNLTVDYSAAELSDFPDGMIQDGALVDVKATAGAAGDVLAAVKIEYEERDEETEEEGEEKTLEGLVTAISSASEFTVNGQTVLLTDATEFEDGSAGDIYLNTKIKIEGSYNADGVLVADEVELRRRGDTKLDAVVESVDTETGTFTVLGTSIRVTPSTVWEDESDEGDQFISLGALITGDRIKIRGYYDTEGTLVATAIERKDMDDEDEFELEGPVSGLVVNSSFTVLGITVSFDSETEFELDDKVSLEDLFVGLAEGDEVKVEGTMISSTELVASSVEVKSEDGRDEFGGERDRGRPDVDEEVDNDMADEDLPEETEDEEGEMDEADEEELDEDSAIEESDEE